MPNNQRPTIRPAIAAVAVFLLYASSANADLIIEVVDSTPTTAGFGEFDVIVRDTDPLNSAAYPVNAFSVELSVDPTSGVSFTDIDTATVSQPYIFGTLQTPPFSFDATPTTDITGQDFNTPGVGVPVGPNDVYGLAHIKYSVDLNVFTGPITVHIVGFGTSLTDPAGGTITFSTSDGSIRAIPEPASIALLASVVPFAWRVRRRIGRRVAG